MEEFIKEIILKMQTGEFSFVFLLVAFLGGLIASLSPCSLGILPIIAAYVGGYGETEGEKANMKNFLQLLSFVLGLSIVLTIIGVICALTGRVFASALGPYWVLIISSLILVMGLNLTGVLELPMPVIVKKMPKSNGQSLFLYPLLIGALFALATTPCSTPILAGIMSFATPVKKYGICCFNAISFCVGTGGNYSIGRAFSFVFKECKKIFKIRGNFTQSFRRAFNFVLHIPLL